MKIYACLQNAAFGAKELRYKKLTTGSESDT